jgi:acyl transferase domain-containing protein/acyl carrier protein
LNKSEDMRGIAIIGMSLRFPGAKNVEEFWHNLSSGIESIQFFSDEELLANGIDAATIQHPNYVKAAGTIPDTDLFAADFFGFNPKEAAIMDPQHRIFLECAWEALENAGYDSEREQARIGTYAGTGWDSYLYANLVGNKELFGSFSSGYQTLLGNEKDFLTTRVSYLLNLKGPSIDVQTACSTSLVAVTLACQSLLNYQCDVALAGGINISVPQQAGYFYEEGGILSPDGHCRAFDAQAQGTVPGSGVGIVVLKRLEEALADGDRIDAVIKGFATNNDGGVKVGYTAPSIEGQAEVVAEALAFAEIEPETVSYVEAHGTGTVLGDPIEVTALSRVYGNNTVKKQFCALGSVKSNLGHLDAAAGVAGLIKAVLSLKNGAIAPSLHGNSPNPELDLTNSPFYVNRELKEWKAGKYPRRAAVSSFGIGGTNAHVVLEAAPVVGRDAETGGRGDAGSEHLLILSAKTESALTTATQNLVNHLREHPDLNLADVAYTLQIGRRGFDYRRMAVCQTIQDAIEALESAPSHQVMRSPVIFAFPGQGTQYVNMGRELYETEFVFREKVDLCAEILQPHLGVDIRQILYPSGASREDELRQTAIAQAVLFTVEYALAQLWMEWGIRPQALIGHSIGEYVAACLAGVFSLEEALKLVAIRGKLMQAQPPGSLLAVSLSEADLKPYLNSEISLAAVNAPDLCVVSGTKEAISQLEKQLNERGITNRLLHTSHAFHSPMMDGMVGEFIAQVRRVNLKPPQIPLISNVTGTWMTASQATDPSYWGRHLRQTVRLSEGISEIASGGAKIWLEVGAGNSLSTFIKQQVPDPLISSIRHPHDSQSDRTFLLKSLGKLWLAGLDIDWARFNHPEKRYRLPLPTYPFERQRYWIDAQVESIASNRSVKRRDLEDWFYVPVWKQSYLNRNNRLTNSKSCWLVFTDSCGVGDEMVKRLGEINQDAIAIRYGNEFRQLSDSEYSIDPCLSHDYDTLLQELHKSGYLPNAIAHLWGVTSSSDRDVDKTQDLGFKSLLLLTQALGRQNLTASLQLAVVTNNLHDITGTETLNPAKATVLGVTRTIPPEYPQINCTSIDVSLPSNPQGLDRLISQLIAEINSEDRDSVIAYRDRHRWIQTFEPTRLSDTDNTNTSLREGGVYLITGGLGGIGLTLAEYLAKTFQAKLVLISRSELPDRSQWQRCSTKRGVIAQKIKTIHHLEELGAQVAVITADVTNLAQMQEAIAHTLTKFGTIHGVIHTAGIAGGGTIQLKKIETAAEVLAPKLQGTLVLAEVLKQIELDFCVLCSSLTSILGEFGQVDYSAANAFLDAFSQASTNKVITINWDTWKEVGMAVTTEIPDGMRQERQASLNLGISQAEGVKVFAKIIDSNLSQVLVSTQDLQEAIAQSKELINSFKSTPDSIDLRVNMPIETSEVEQIITNIWSEVLGISNIGIKDNFFELGGHSLLAVQTISRIRESLGVEIPLQQFLSEAQTIEKLVQSIDKSRNLNQDVSDLEEILAEIESLSIAK